MAWTSPGSCARCAAWELLVADTVVRYFAAAAEAAGREQETLEAPATAGELRAMLIDRYGDAMARVFASGSFLVDGVVSRDPSTPIGASVDVLPPFAGG